MFTSCFARCCSPLRCAKRCNDGLDAYARPESDGYSCPNKHCKGIDFLLNLGGEMQTVIQVITTGSGSLREKIMTDPQLQRFDLIPTEHQRPGRPHGWAKIHSETAHGAINLEWHGRSRTLICRVVTKLGNKPNSIIGDFVDYLLARHQSRILAIHIMRR